jgi:hypothetical protein
MVFAITFECQMLDGKQTPWVLTSWAQHYGETGYFWRNGPDCVEWSELTTFIKWAS